MLQDNPPLEDEPVSQTLDEESALCEFETIKKGLKICWCEKKCRLGQGAYGCVYKGKWKENPRTRKIIEVAVKVPTRPYHVKYEIETLRKVNEHLNILKFYGQVKYGPYR